MLALDGIKILDLSRLAPGPYCSMLLGDMGADVLLVEAAAGASDKLGSAARPHDPAADERNAAYNAFGRNKRSVTLNLKQQEARDIFYRLCEDADIVLEGFRPGVVKRLGVDYDTVAKINPRIIYCSLSGFGQTGPYSNLVGHDINYIAIGGALGVIGWPEQPPALPINLLADFAGGGLMAAFAICTAIIAREKTGRGQYIDIAMSDGVVSLLTAAASQYFGTGYVVRPGQYLLNGAAPFYNVYKTKDGGWFSLGSIEGHFWEALCKVMGREDFIPHQHDASKHPEIFEHFREQFKTKTREEWFALMSQYDICAAPVLSLDEVFEDAHNVERKMVVEVDHPTLGKVKQAGIAAKLSDTPGKVRSTAPQPGRDTEDVLNGLGYAAEDVARLRTSGVV